MARALRLRGRRIIRLLRRGWRVLREWQLYRQRLDRRKGARSARRDHLSDSASAGVAASWPRTRAHTLKAGCAADRATDDGESGDWVYERGAGKEKAKVGSLHLRRLVSLDAEAPESVGASQRLAWMLLGSVHSFFDVQIKIGSGCVLRTRQSTHGAQFVREIWYCTVLC